MAENISYGDIRNAFLQATDEEKEILLRDFPQAAYSEDDIKTAFAQASPDELEILKKDFPEFGGAGLGSVLLNVPAGALAATGESVGGIMQAVEDFTTGTGLGKTIADESRFAGEGLADEMALRPDASWSDYAKNILYSGATSAAQQAPLIAAAGLGAINPLTAAATMGVISGGQQYAEARRQNYGPLSSLLQGSAYGVAEGLGEKVGIDTLLAKTGLSPKALAAKLVKYIAAEEVSEISTEAMQYATDVIAQSITENKDAKFEEFWPRVKDTFMSTLVAAPLLGGVGVGAQVYNGARQQAPVNIPDNVSEEEAQQVFEQAAAENPAPQNQQATTDFLTGASNTAPNINSQDGNWLSDMANVVDDIANASAEQKNMADEAIKIILQGPPPDPRLNRTTPNFQTSPRPEMINPIIPTPATNAPGGEQQGVATPPNVTSQTPPPTPDKTPEIKPDRNEPEYTVEEAWIIPTRNGIQAVPISNKPAVQPVEAIVNEPPAEGQKSLTDHIYDSIKAGNDFTDKTALKRYAKEKGFENDDTRPVYEAYEAAKVREAQEVYNQFKDKPDELINKFIDFNDKQLSNARRTDTVNDLQQFSTPVNISALGNLILDRIGATMVLEPTAGNGGLLLNGERKAIVNELDSARFDNVKQLPNVVEAFNHDVLDERSMTDITAAANSAGVDSVIANPPFGIGETKSGEPREFKIIKDSLNKTGVDKGVFVIADAHPFTLTPSKKEPHLTRIGARVFEANNTGRVADYEITKKREYGPTKELIYYLKNIETGEEIAIPERVLNGRRENGNRFFIDTPVSRKMDDFFKWLYGNYNVVLNEPIAGAEYSKGGTKYPTRLIAINGRGPTAYKTENVERRNKTVREIYEKIKGVDFNDNANRKRTDDGPARVDNGSQPDQLLAGTGNNVDAGYGPAADRPAVREGEKARVESERPVEGLQGDVSARVGNEGQNTPDIVSEQSDNKPDRVRADERPAIEQPERQPELPSNARVDDGVSENGKPVAADTISDEVIPGRTEPESGQRNGKLEKPVQRGEVSAAPSGVNGRELLESNITPYEPKSTNTVYGGLKVPSNIYNETNEATNRLKDELEAAGHTFTSYVSEKTGIKEDLLTRKENPVLTAEQVESVALTISNIESREQTIIGHDTGTGKGRIGAAVLSYAVKNQKKIPVFFTMKPTLATDILRDLMDIHDFGSKPGANINDFLKEFKILSVNELTSTSAGEEKKKVMIYNPLNREQALPAPPTLTAKNMTPDRFADIVKRGGYNIIFSTYSQFQDFQKNDARYKALLPFVENGIAVFDEAHSSAGVLDENAEKIAEDGFGFKNAKDKKQTMTSLAFMNTAGLIERAKAPVLLSATFSKRANTLPIYLWKDRAKFGLAGDMWNRIESLKSGTATAIEYVTKALTKLGKYLRMEKDYEGVQVFSENIQFDNPAKVSGVINDVAKVFQTITRLDSDFKEAFPSSRKAGALNLEGMGFSSVLHNYLNQLMFAIRTDAIAKKAAELVRSGKKVTIAFENTMESIVNDLYGSPDGKPLNNDLVHIFVNVLNKHILTRSVSEQMDAGEGKTQKGKPWPISIGKAYINSDGFIEVEIDTRDSSPQLQTLKNDILYTVLREDENGKEITLASVIEDMREFLKGKKFDYPISPIDSLKRSLVNYLGEDYQNKIGEITKRSYEITADGTYKVRTPESVNAVINKFNNGSASNPLSKDQAYDILLINRSGSTGISLHNDPRFGTVHEGPKGVERTMLIAQPLGDPNEIMQMLGRIHRFGQLTAPSYYLLNTGIPAETRMSAALISKLKSLNASVSADRSGGQISFEGADVFNVVGDEVMDEYLQENPEYAAYMGLKVKQDEKKGTLSVSTNETENLAQKVFGKLAALTRRQQEDFLEGFMYAYNTAIENHNMLGTNPLVSQTLQLDAETLDEMTAVAATDDTPFGAPVVRKIIMANNTVKPVQIAELEKVAPQNKKATAAKYEQAKDKAQKHMEFMEREAQNARDAGVEKQKRETMQRHRDRIRATARQLNPLIEQIGKVVTVSFVTDKAKGTVTEVTGFLSDVQLAPSMSSPYNADAKDKPLTFLDRNVTLRLYVNNEGERAFNLANIQNVLSEDYNYDLKDQHENWDTQIQRNRREVRVFYTGNMLKIKDAFAGQEPKGTVTKINTKDGRVEYGFLVDKKAININDKNWKDYAGEPIAQKATEHYLKMPQAKEADPQRVFEGREKERTFGAEVEPRTTAPDPLEIRAGKYLAGLNRVEIVRLAEALGSIPEVWKRLRRGVLGSFNDGTGKIKISAAALKEGDIEQITTAIAHEIGHLIDWKEGSVPETLTRGNILGHIGTLARFMKTTLNLDPAGQPPYLDKKERAKMYRAARKAALNPDGSVDYKAYRENYLKLISDYIDDNNLIHREVLIGELTALTQHFLNVSNEDLVNDDKFWDYATSADELYANAMGAFLINPAMLGEIAPTAADMLYNYMSEKPATLKLYQYMQKKIAGGDRYADNLIYLKAKMMQADARQSEFLAKRADKQGLKESLLTSLMDRLTPLLKYANAADRDESSFKMLSVAQKLRSINDIIESYLVSFLPEINRIIAENKIDITDLGLKAYFTRVIEERSKQGVIDLTDEKLAERLNAELDKNYTAEQIAAMETIFERLREARRPLIESLVSAGLYNQALAEKLLDNKYYFTFDITEHLEKMLGSNNSISQRIYKQYGTLKVSANPFVSTILKDIALTRLNVEMTFTRQAISFLQEKGVTVEKAKKDQNGKPLSPPLKSGMGLVEILINGKAEGYYVPADIAKAINENTFEAGAGLQALAALNNLSRFSFTSGNPAFIISNAFRDVQGSFLKTPYVLENFATWGVKMSKAFWNAIADTEDQKKLNEMLGRGMLYGDRSMNYQPDADLSTWDNILRKYKIANYEDFDSKNAPAYLKITNMLMAATEYLASPVINLSARIEKASKVGTFDFLNEIKDKYNLSEAEVDYIVTEFAGTPNAKRKGKLTPYTNNILLFSNVWAQGYKSHVDAAKYSPFEYSAKIAGLAVAPVVLTWLLSYFDDDGWWEKVSEYYKSSFNVIPLHWFGGPKFDKNGKPVFLTLPKEEMQRTLGASLWKVLNSLKDGEIRQGFQQIFDVWGGDVPKLAPIINAAVAVKQYASGKNPYDDFRGKAAIDPRTFSAQDFDTDKAFMIYLANLFGLNTFYKMDPSYRRRGGETPSMIEQVSKVPVWGLNVAGRILKADDSGERQQIGKIIGKDETQNARELNLVDSYLDKIEGNRLNEITQAEREAKNKHLEYFKDARKRLKNPKEAQIKAAPKDVRKQVREVLK